MLMTFANGIQPMSAGFFTSIGKARLGVIMSLTRQVLFLLPLIVIFPIFFGIDGVMYAGPIADTSAFVLAVVFARRELGFSACDGSLQRHYSSPSQCDPARRAFLCYRNITE